MSVTWWLHRKMAQLLVVRCGAEAEIYLEMAMRSYYRGKVCYREVDLLETIPPPVFEKHMGELTELLLTEGGSSSSSRPTSPSQLVVRAIFSARFLASTFADIHVVVQAGKETESDNMGLRPHKMCNTVSVPKLHGDIRDVLGDKFPMPGQKEIVVGEGRPRSDAWQQEKRGAPGGLACERPARLRRTRGSCESSPLKPNVSSADWTEARIREDRRQIALGKTF
ncbi:unnamed protein product [Lactuca saligna]|uniref:Uncharacterized protein n=1 Tax=Lactuca saligna TaxID=75948 RepID=A0AA36DYQ0_LACSI|nr:unnamed protein product [Lactuca saligna]